MSSQYCLIKSARLEIVPRGQLHLEPFLSRRTLRILIADDDEGCRQCVAALLSEEGHDIHTASGGLEALREAQRLRGEAKRLDLTILDCEMPDFTGTDVFRRLVVELPGLEAVFMTGSPSKSLEEEVRLAGGNELLRKPLDLHRMRRAVRRTGAGGGFVGVF